MSKPRRRHTAEQKAELLRQHVAEKKPVSEVCNEAEIQPSLFYTWQRELLAGAHTVFSTRRAPSRENELEAKISRLEARVARKDQIIAEVTEEYVSERTRLHAGHCGCQRLCTARAQERSSPNFPVKSPYGSPGSVKLLVPPTCFWGGTRFEVPRFS